ncbi:MAG: TatD family hydrolase [Defluviitaleaceae bacterium]|nr:TatD family hydrolase [Defluviitaleaceae bacterium]
MNAPDLIFDTHTHYDFSQFDGDRDTVINALASNGVGMVLNVGSDMRSSAASVALARKYPFIYATVGVHPHDAKTLTERSMDELKTLAADRKVVAFGEIGLDFFRNLSPPDVQRKWFKRQLEIAWGLRLPVIIHSRDADEEVYGIMAGSPYGDGGRWLKGGSPVDGGGAEGLRSLEGEVGRCNPSAPPPCGVTRNCPTLPPGGVIHAFPGDVALAQRYVDMGFYLGIGGVLTYDKTGRLKAVVEAMPLDRLLLETDCPYLTPAPHRGKRNESGYLRYVVDAVSQIKNVSPDVVRGQTYENARTLFGV